MKRVAGLDIPQTFEEAGDPRRMALIVYDLQIGILRQLKSSDAILACASKVPSAARAAGMRVFFRRHMWRARHAHAAARPIESLKFAGDAIITDNDAFCQALQRHPA